jgi:hypothetical protein
MTAEGLLRMESPSGVEDARECEMLEVCEQLILATGAVITLIGVISRVLG